MVLEFRNLNQFYGGSHTLWDFNLDVPRDACTVLLGRNGVGKTTLLKCLMGMLPLRSGTVTYDGQDITTLKPHQRARLGIAYVPQGREIFPRLSVTDNLRVPLAAKRGNGQIPPRIYELFPVLQQMRQRRGGDLSGGQQQQLAIARALMLHPKLLILDEPTEGIQPNIVHEIGDVIMRLNRDEGITVLLVEQKLAFARRVGQCFGLMERGRIVAAGRMEELGDELIHRHLAV